MPRPPRERPGLGAMVPGALAPDGGGSWDVCGSGRLSTRPTGAAEGEIEPVASLFLLELSPNRVASPLQPATPMASNARTAARGHDRERNGSCTQNIATHSYAYAIQGDELTTAGEIRL